ncbi:hypothetical protein WJX74_002469 [Apatococcus lobatus]|uniref:Glycine cleavage system P protein n=1 Tax=Apatococcus lobatus TaxID=904363 RepID=A0AAW1RTM7_9CHLO
MARGRTLKTAADLLRSAGRSVSRARAAEQPCDGSVLLYDVAGRGFASRLVPGAAAIPRALWQSNPSVLVPASVQQRGISVEALKPSDQFAPRHNSASPAEIKEMASVAGFDSIDALIDATVPQSIRREDRMEMGKYTDGMTESGFLAQFKEMASKNKMYKTFLGMGYYNTYLPPVIQRNILENPGWYTQYTPYQSEIAQGRLESLLNFQTVITELTGMGLSNCSLLDEATAAAEAMTMCSAIARGKKQKWLMSDKCHPQTIEVCRTRAEGLGLDVIVGDEASFKYDSSVFGVLVQQPATDGSIKDYKSLTKEAHDAKVKVCVATDLLALTMMEPPSTWGADIVVGSAQRFGVPMGYGGPHAAFLSCSEEYKRLLPGRIIGISVDSNGKRALRMAMQTREQHIRRDKATSNICTAQALLANIAAMYAIYHGPQGLTKIAQRANGQAHVLAAGAKKLGLDVGSEAFFDTVCINVGDAQGVVDAALQAELNVRKLDDSHITVSFDETTSIADVDVLFKVLNKGSQPDFSAESLASEVEGGVGNFKRSGSFMQQPVFNSFHSEHEMLRYLKRLENRDLSLCHSMIALGSCTMKLNASSEMMPISWPELNGLHPFVPVDQAAGYAEMFEDLAQQLAVITGFDAVSLQPNSGAAGEYAGLMAIRSYHKARGDDHRNVCIIPLSAHGTNPASAIMAGMKIVTVPSDDNGNIDFEAFKQKAEENKENLAAFMVTYPSTHGVYEENVDKICQIIHDNGGQVYMDGANMNAQVGLTAPGIIGADVCHLNLHKTFCIPHGGGGPGMGPIGVRKHLAPYLATHPVIPTGALPGFKSDAEACGTLAAAPFGSSLILPISYAYISMMGSDGLTMASKLAILNANYMAKVLEPHYPVLFKGPNGTCAHEFIMDLRQLEKTSGITPEDVAKRLIDYGFHAPTMSWPVPGTLMVEPTESESKAELDRWCAAMISIRKEIAEIESGKVDRKNNVITNAPHPADEVLSEEWDRPYTREQAAFPAAWVQQAKFWPVTSRVDNVHGDRHLIASLPQDEPCQETEVEAATA